MWGWCSAKRPTFGPAIRCIEAEMVNNGPQMAKMVIINGPLVTNGLTVWCKRFVSMLSHMWGCCSMNRPTFGQAIRCIEAELVKNGPKMAKTVIINVTLVTDGLTFWC